MGFWETIIDLSESWIIVIALVVWRFHRRQPEYMKPVIVYLVLALLFNLFCDTFAYYYQYRPERYQSNTIVYNIHSLVRFGCFMFFFMPLYRPQFWRLKRGLLAAFIFCVVVLFFFFDNFFNTEHISSDLMSIEGFFLIFYSLIYYLSVLRTDDEKFLIQKHFWVVTGICVYSVVNFFIFLFYLPLLHENENLAERIWNFHNIAFIIFILFIIKAIHVPARD